jgi:hypothetical protein
MAGRVVPAGRSGLSELDGDQFFGDPHVVPGQSCDVFRLLSEDEDEDRSAPVACLQSVGVDDSFQCFVLSRFGESRNGAAAVRNDGDPGWGGFGLDGPFEEALGDGVIWI